MDFEEVKNFLSEKFHLDLEKRESDYLGSYYKYQGLYADILRVMKVENRVEIEASFYMGKSKDRKSRYDFLKKSFNNYPSDFKNTLDKILDD